MRKDFKSRLLIGIPGLLITILAFIMIITTVPNMNSWAFYLVLAILAGCMIGFIYYIFNGKMGFVSGAGCGFGLVAVIAIANKLPFWISGMLFVAAGVILLGLPEIEVYKKDSAQNSDAGIENKEEESGQVADAEIIEFKNSFGFGTKSLILLSGMGTMYQLIKSGEKLYL